MQAPGPPARASRSTLTIYNVLSPGPALSREGSIESGFLVFAGVAALLVISPGASMAVVTRNAVGGGRVGAVLTAVGINCGNSVYALASALGLSVVFARSPGAVGAVKLVGAVYLGFLGGQSVWRARPQRAVPSVDAERVARLSRWTSFTEGLVTNLLHPAVALFYLTYVPQFIAPDEPYIPMFLTLAAVHIAISFAWLATFGLAIDSLGQWLAKPIVRRGLEAVTGVALLALAARFVFGGA